MRACDSRSTCAVWLSWLGTVPCTEGCRIDSYRGTRPDCRLDPKEGACRRQPAHLSLPSLLKN